MSKRDPKKIAYPYAFFEGEVTPIEYANVNIMTNALQYGTGWFGGIRGYIGEDKKSFFIFRLEDHIKRFLASARVLGVKMKYSASELKDIIIDLTKKNKPTSDTYYRPFAYLGSLALAPNLAHEEFFEFALYMIPLGDYIATDKGNSVGVSSWRRISDNSIPSRAKISGGYINSALAKKEAHDRGFVEAIVLTDDGHVSEGSAMNVFIVRNGVLITSPKYQDILEGITRDTILQLASTMGIPALERPIDRTELYVCDEAFFSGTGAQVAWIDSIDGRSIADGKEGPITRALREAFFSIVRGKDKRYDTWLTKVCV
jgi:branched-chain amino acid aminotransferase